MDKIAQKRNISSMQVFKTFQLMLKNDYSMFELIEKLNSDESDSIYNNSIVSKYINTCRYCGIEILKIHNKYYITKLPFGFELSYSEINLLNNLRQAISSNMPQKYINTFEKFYTKLVRNANKKIIKIDTNQYQKVFEQFEYAVTGKRKIKLLFKNRCVLECIPITIKEQNGKIYLKVYKNKCRMIDISRLSGLEVLSERFTPVKEETIEVVYKLKPPMAKRYELRSNEIQLGVEAEDGSIVILNKDENKEDLISRLLRYDVCCEILKPASLREEMMNTIFETLKNYGES